MLHYPSFQVFCFSFCYSSKFVGFIIELFALDVNASKAKWDEASPHLNLFAI